MKLMNADWQAGYIQDKKSFAVTVSDARALFFQGRAAFNMEGTWIPMVLPADGIDFELGVAYFPSMKDGVTSTIPIGMGAALCVNANTKVADQVAEFINFLYTDEQNIAASMAAGEQVLCRNVDVSLMPADTNPMIKSMYALMDAAGYEDRMSYTNYGFFPGGLASYVYEDVEKVFIGDMTIREYTAN
jgi:ABC-type glycerol-3-phosphate transport system substrate-binding protein